MMYKGFNEDMTCRNFQYKVGEHYKEDRAELCETGFHACEFPLECFDFYSPNDSIYHGVDLDELSEEQEDDSTKRVGKSIYIRGKLSSKEMLEHALKYVHDETPYSYQWKSNDTTTISDRYKFCAAVNEGTQSVASVNGEHSVANTGSSHSVACATAGSSGALTEAHHSIAAVTGNACLAVADKAYSIAAATGENSRAETRYDDCVAVATNMASTASATNTRSVALATFTQSRAEAFGEATAISLGPGGLARGGIGSWLILADWRITSDKKGWKFVITKIHSVQVDGEKILPDVWYMVSNGKVVRAENQINDEDEGGF